MIIFKKLLAYLVILSFAWVASAFTTNDAVTIFDAYNTAFRDGAGYYPGWWTGAEEIEMAEDAYDSLPTATRKAGVANACSQFASHHGSTWFASGSCYNEYNDDIAWAVIAFARGYMITGNSTFRDVAKNNFDGMYNRAWDTNFLGSGLFWRQSDKKSKNACIEGPAAIAACYLYSIFGDTNYLNKAQAIYAFNRRFLLNTNSGAVYDSVATNGTISSFSLTYNQGTFIGSANYLYRITGLPFYYQDAILVAKYTQNSMSSSGILPEYGSDSDLSGFNGIFARWMARFAKDQNLWAAYGPWLTTNANAAWSVRYTNNLAWQKWKTTFPGGTNVLDDWGCSAAVVVMQVADPSPADPLVITPTAGFTAVAQRSLLPVATSVDLKLTNTSIAAFNWSLANTSAWLNVSISNGILPAATASNITVSLVSSATTNPPAGRYFAAIQLTNLASGVISSRIFTLAISSGDAPIALTGYNASVLAPNNAIAGAPGATAFDIGNSYCFYQAGQNASTRGLPPDGTFTSQFDNKTVFQLKPYGNTNTLMLGSIYPNPGTLTLTTPRAYNSISILASSAGGGGIGTFVLNFSNGTQSQVFNFTAQDWFNSATNIAIQGIGRLKLTTLATEDNGPVSPRMFHTTINLAALEINQAIASITFTKPATAIDTGIFAISGTVMPDAPDMVFQPVSQTNNLPAQGVTFNALASGIPPLSYQWYYSSNGNPGTYALLASEINTNLVFSPVLQPTNAGSYFVLVTNSFGSVTSSVARLTIYREPFFTQQPTPTNVFRFVGATNVWIVTANAALPVNYYWRLNGTNLPTATNPTLRLNNLQTNNAGNYSVVVSNTFGVITSSVVTLTVLPAPTYPLGQAVLADKPLGYWRLDEASGMVAHDYVMGNNGTYTPTVLLGQPGNKLIDPHKVARFGLLAANNSCVTNIAGLTFATSGNAAFSIEAWVNGGTQTTDAGIVTKGYGSGGEQFDPDCGGTSHAFRFFVRDASGVVHLASTTVTPNNQWHHLVGVCDSANGYVRLYVDGTNATPGTITANSGILSSATPVSIGARQSGVATSYDNQFLGYMEEVAIYGYALSSNQVAAHFQAATNRAPVFFSNPFTVASIIAGQAYSSTLATNAIDSNGDAMTFAKVSGPAWLNVASNGSLSGTALSSNVGTNNFLLSVGDPGGMTNTATMNLNVLAPPAIVATTLMQGNNLQLSWNGGIAPYQVQWTPDLINPNWQNLGVSVAVSNLWVVTTNEAAFYRILGQ